MARRYRVIYDRNLCIGAAACTTSTPEGFEIDKEDGKANLINGSKFDHEKFDIIIDESEFKKFQDASEVCPVAGCIKVVKMDED